jgi:hypothetical protein
MSNAQERINEIIAPAIETTYIYVTGSGIVHDGARIITGQGKSAAFQVWRTTCGKTGSPVQPHGRKLCKRCFS